ncbi:hypothetical protein YC2023_084639 [Brassica napus]
MSTAMTTKLVLLELLVWLELGKLIWPSDLYSLNPCNSYYIAAVYTFLKKLTTQVRIETMGILHGFINFPDFKSELEHIGSFKEEVNKIVYIADNYRNNQ